MPRHQVPLAVWGDGGPGRIGGGKAEAAISLGGWWSAGPGGLRRSTRG